MIVVETMYEQEFIVGIAGIIGIFVMTGSILWCIEKFIA
jgi:hypothetical protein